MPLAARRPAPGPDTFFSLATSETCHEGRPRRDRHRRRQRDDTHLRRDGHPRRTRVNVTHGRGVVEVSEITRGGSTVRTARFLANRVLALVEHPAADDPVADEITPSLRSV